MKTYRELYFRGSKEQLLKFIQQIKKYILVDWHLNISERWNKYLLFDYDGSNVDKARVSIYIGDECINKGELQVGNIVPLIKNELSVDEYNAVLMRFYDDVIKPFKEKGTDIDISQPSDDIFEPTNIVTESALKKLKTFCAMANKSTGSSHPCDQERWFDFICQTVDDGKMFDYTTLANFLQDNSYWGEKPENFTGVIGNYAWDEEYAHQLASEYENLCEILLYYKKSRGI